MLQPLVTPFVKLGILSFVFIFGGYIILYGHTEQLVTMFAVVTLAIYLLLGMNVESMLLHGPPPSPYPQQPRVLSEPLYNFPYQQSERQRQQQQQYQQHGPYHEG